MLSVALCMYVLTLFRVVGQGRTPPAMGIVLIIGECVWGGARDRSSLYSTLASWPCSQAFSSPHRAPERCGDSLGRTVSGFSFGDPITASGCARLSVWPYQLGREQKSLLKCEARAGPRSGAGREISARVAVAPSEGFALPCFASIPRKARTHNSSERALAIQTVCPSEKQVS